MLKDTAAIESTTPISLVICTRNRCSQLELALASLWSLDFPAKWELVLVDNGSTDDTAALIENYSPPAGCCIVRITEPRRGVGYARNTGWEAASSELVAFIDDDCYPDSAYLTTIYDFFKNRPDMGFIGGRVLLYDPTDLPITIQTSTEPYAFVPRSYIHAGVIHGANFSFRKQALREVDGFDSRLGAGTPFPCEDVDVLARISAKGWFGAYAPEVIVHHHHRRKTVAEGVALMRSYDRGRGAYFAKSVLSHPARWVYLKHWLYRFRKQPAIQSLYEIRAAVDFWKICLTQRQK